MTEYNTIEETRDGEKPWRGDILPDEPATLNLDICQEWFVGKMWVKI